MDSGSIWDKESFSIDDVGVALDLFIDALKGDHQKVASAEEHIHAVVMAYIRCQAHIKLPRSDGARVVDNSSALASDILLYLYSRKHLPAFLQAVKDNPSDESKMEFIKRLQSLLFLKLRRMPIDWSRTRERIPKIFPVPEDINAISTETQQSQDGHSGYMELLGAIENVLAGFSTDDQTIMRYRLFDDLTFSESAKRIGMKSDAVRKRYGKLVHLLKNELGRQGFEL